MVNKQQVLRYKRLILILAIISLAFRVIGAIRIGSFSFYFSVGNVINLIMGIAQSVLLLIYLLRFYKERKAAILISIIFGLMALPYLFNLCRMLGYFKYYIIADITTIIVDIIIIAAFVLPTINAIKGSFKRIFIIIPTIVFLLAGLASVISYCNSIKYYLISKQYYSLIIGSINLLGTIAFFIAFLFAILSVLPPKEHLSPAHSLKLIKEKYDLGIITEEEYQAQRSEIINNL